MAEVSELALLGNIILGRAIKVQQLGVNCYKASAAWDKFLPQVDQLRQNVELWERETVNRGFLVDPALISCLNHANSSLQEEEVKLKSRKTAKTANLCGACAPRMSTTVFPAILGQNLQDALDNVPEMLRESIIISDSGYVSLRISEDEVTNVLNNPEGPLVVLLHGGAGKGKSVLARAISRHYTQESHLFESVFFFECGPNSEAMETQLEIIQMLGCEPQLSSQDDGKNKSIRILHQIKNLLATRKMLLILDDVSNAKYLKQIVQVCGTAMKCLVTSRHADLCDTLHDESKYKMIQIQDIDRDQARKILAGHIGLPNSQIPTHLQELADKMINQTEFNPLAVASLANAIDKSRASELMEWEDASENFLIVLRSTELPQALWSGKYSKSFWVTMRQTINSLNGDAEKLLLLTSACQGPHVPEDIVHLLFKSTKKMFSGTFSKARRELEDRQLIKINNPSSNNDHGQQRTWSVHSLHRLYIEEEMREQRESMFSTLVSNYNVIHLAKVKDSDFMTEIDLHESAIIQEQMVTTLFALYFGKEFAERAAFKMNIPFKYFNNHRRNAIEPIILLLNLSVKETTPDSMIMKVFVTYICNNILDDEAVTYLLQLPVTAPIMWRVLANITFIADLEGGEEHLVESISGLMCSDGALERLVNSLCKDTEPFLQDLAADTLANLAFGNVMTKVKIANHKGVLSELAVSMSKDANPILQENAARALRNLASGDVDTKLHIANHTRVLSELVLSLSKDVNPSLQEKAAEALGNLGHGVDKNKVSIVDYSTSSVAALQGLARLLNQNNIPKLQQAAAYAFSVLASVDDAVSRMKIKTTKGVIEGLILLMSNHGIAQFPLTEKFAVEALTLLDAVLGNNQSLLSGPAYTERASVNLRLGMYAEALADLDKARELDPNNGSILRFQCFIRAVMGDFEGALKDANASMVMDKGCPISVRVFNLQERGVLKRMMGDLLGALADFNEGLQLETDNYELLKHRGYAKFLMNDEEGARADAEWALRIKPYTVDYSEYGTTSLGESSLEFLNYRLR